MPTRVQVQTPGPAWSRVAFEGRTIAGPVLMPFLTRNAEGFDVNKPYEWDLAEHMVTAGTVQLPVVTKTNFS
jgi:CMP-N,N'-diacetyllegionaminic acid synthase